MQRTQACTGTHVQVHVQHVHAGTRTGVLTGTCAGARADPHTVRGPRSEVSLTSTYRFCFPMHQNNVILLLDDNALFLLGSIIL
jgi:hypothetical protein